MLILAKREVRNRNSVAARISGAVHAVLPHELCHLLDHARRALVLRLRLDNHALHAVGPDLQTLHERLGVRERHERVAPAGHDQELLAPERVRGRVGGGVGCARGVVCGDVGAEAVGVGGRCEWDVGVFGAVRDELGVVRAGDDGDAEG